jgi:hypothetical protein
MSDEVYEHKIEPPKLIPSIVEGFNAIASHIYIILFPILFDMLLWFGPMIRVKDLILPVMLNATDLSSNAYGQDSQMIVETSKQMWTSLLEHFNLFFSLRTYPVGLPSLLLGKGVANNPLGSVSIIEVESTNIAFWILAGCTVVGIVLGCLYYALIANATDSSEKSLKFSSLAKQTAQIVILSLILVAALFILSIPAICLISSLVLFIPSLGEIPVMLFGFLLVWILLPLVFSPHGIFADQLKATTSIANSIRLVRSLMSATGIFLILIILLGYGLDILWATPEANDWMLLVGIIGHAFISSGLIAASFKFYNSGVRWLKTTLKAMNAGKPKNIS